VTGAVPGGLVPAASVVRATRPGLRLYLLVNTSDVLVDALLAGTLDVAIGRLPQSADPGGLDTVALADEPLGIVARARHPLADRAHVDAADLEGATWILQPPGSPTRQESNRMLDDLGVHVPVDVIETASIVATLALLRDTDAVSVMPAGLAAHYGAPGWLTRLKVRQAGTGSRYELITRRNRTLAPAALAFVEATRALAAGRRAGRAAFPPGGSGPAAAASARTGPRRGPRKSGSGVASRLAASGSRRRRTS
jgi:DNA-binding transcriptional LysR family regulator